MSINIGDNLSYLGAKPLDGRLKYDTVSEMAEMADNVLYDGCLAYCVGTGKTYQWKSSNTVDSTTGKWREFTSGSGQPIEYVSELPTSGIEDKIYGLATTSGSLRTINLIKPVSGTLTKQQAIDYFSKYFTVTDIDDDTIELSVYPDLVISRDNWEGDSWVAGTNFNKLYYKLSVEEIESYMDSALYALTGAWDEAGEYPLHCTSAYFPVYKYYAGVEDTQELNEIGAGSVDIDNDTIIENQAGEISVSSAYKKIFNGTEAEWNALTTAEKIQWDEAHIPDATESTDSLWYNELSDIDPDWQTNFTSIGELVNKFPHRKSVYVNFSLAEARTAASIGLLPSTVDAGGILHFVTGTYASIGRAYGIFVPDLARNNPYFCQASNWKSASSWAWKYDVYSTNETVTNKVWVDGKPIYRKVLFNNDKTQYLLGSNSTLDISMLEPNEAEEIIKFDIVIHSVSGDDFITGDSSWINANCLWNRFKIDTGKTNITSMANGNSYYLRSIVLEYTKTTD